MLEKLTPEQEALIPVYRDKWKAIALSTEPINRQKATEAVKAAYAALGYEEPEILVCDSPYPALKKVSGEDHRFINVALSSTGKTSSEKLESPNAIA